MSTSSFGAASAQELEPIPSFTRPVHAPGGTSFRSTGVAIQAAGEDYRWTWLVCGAAILISIPVMAPLRDER